MCSSGFMWAPMSKYPVSLSSTRLGTKPTLATSNLAKFFSSSGIRIASDISDVTNSIKSSAGRMRRARRR